MTMSMASASNQHRGGGGRQSSPCPTSSSRSIHSHVHDVVSVTRERFNDVVSSMQGRQGIEPPPSSSSSSPSPPSGVSLVGLRDGLETIVKVMFAPCVSMDIGGVPREEMPATTASRVATAPGILAAGGRGAATSSGTPPTPPWGASIPFEVSASSVLGGSLVHSQSSLRDLAPGGHAQSSTQQQRQQHRPQQQQSHPSSSGRETRMAESQARLRQLGARHQLAGGFPGESLADRSRPIHPVDDAREEVLRRQGMVTNDGPELVDFDDGISAISSHTLEEMERRQLAAREKRTGGGGGRTGITMRVNPRDFTQVVEEGREWGGSAVQGGGDGEGWRQWGGGTLDLVEEVEEKNTEVVFCDPFYEEEGGTPRRDDVADLLKNAGMNRVASNRTNLTMNTTGTDESHEFEELYRRQEAMYWQDHDRVADAERMSRGLTRNHDAATARSSCQKMSIEERARRLREISRSRSRSDGTGNSCVVSRRPSCPMYPPPGN